MQAQDATPFYKDKQIRIIISAGVAGGYMEYARTLADHMGKHIAGHPSFLVQSMPGAGGLNATNYLYTQAPQDGTTIGIVHSTIPLSPLWGKPGRALRDDEVQLDRRLRPCARRLPDVGDVAGEDLAGYAGEDRDGRQFRRPGSQMDAYPALLNKLFGAKIKVIAGYKDGTSIYLAMERGEVDGRCGGQMSTIKAMRPEWLTEKKIVAPIVISMQRHPDFPDTPTVLEFAKDDATRQVLELMTVSQGLDRPVLMPPNTPPRA